MPVKKLATVFVCVSAFALLAACGGGGNSASKSKDGEIVTITYPILGGGGLGSVPGWYAGQSGIAKKYGFKLKFRNYDSIQAFYSGLATDEYSLGYGTPDGLVALAAAGAPINMIGTLSAMSGVIITRKNFQWKDPTSLKGKRFAASEASGTYTIMAAFIEKEYGISFKTDVQFVPAATLPAGPSQVAAGTADAALSWEPAATAAVLANPNLKIQYRLGDDYTKRTGDTLWHFTLFENSRSSLTPKQINNFRSMLKESTKYVTEHPDIADQVAVEHGVVKGAFLDAIKSGRLPYIVEPMSKKNIVEMKDQLARSGKDQGLKGPIPDAFWGLNK